jgi:hypothetical protein
MKIRNRSPIDSIFTRILPTARATKKDGSTSQQVTRVGSCHFSAPHLRDDGYDHSHALFSWHSPLPLVSQRTHRQTIVRIAARRRILQESKHTNHQKNIAAAHTRLRG